MKRKRWTVLAVFAMVVALLPLSAVPAAAGGGVVINEFTAKGTEWIELFNPGSTLVGLTDWYLTDGEDSETLSGSIAAGDFLVIDTTLALSNDGDEIELHDGSGSLVDVVAYGTHGGAPLPPYGHSTARSPNGYDSDDSAADWNVDLTPTKGTENDGPETALGSSVIINEQNAYSDAWESQDFYELHNPTGLAVDLAGWSASDGDDIVPLDGVVPAGGFQVFKNLSISSKDVLYLWDASGVRVDQLGRAGKFEKGSFQRVPDGAGPSNGFDFASSGGEVTYLDCAPTPGYTNAACVPPIAEPLEICEIQGPGASSPYDGWLVETTGVVYAVQYNGFYMEREGCDTDAATSDGIFVLEWGSKPSIGEEVEVEGVASEYFGLTEISASRIGDLGAGALPDPVVIDPKAARSEGYYETLEGMRVDLAEGQAYVGTNKFGESFVVPGKVKGRMTFGRYADAPEILAVADGLNGSDGLPLFAYQRAYNVVGALTFSFDNYKLNVEDASLAKVKGPAKVPAKVFEVGEDAGKLSVATWNLENVFDENDPDADLNVPAISPEDQATKSSKLVRGMVDWMGAPPVIAVQEVENFGLLDDIAGDLNAYLGGGSYVPILLEGNDPRGIDVGFLVDSSRVAYGNVRQIGKSSFSGGACEGGAADNLVYDRVPLAVDVSPLGSSETFTVVSNHFKSKFGGTSANNYFEDCRVEQAQTLTTALAELDHVIVVGDLNAFRDSETIATFEDAGYTDMVDRMPKPRRFSYVFQGRTQFLDHVLVSPDLVGDVVKVDSPKFDSDAPVPLFEDEAWTAYGSSDHDPIVSWFELDG